MSRHQGQIARAMLQAAAAKPGTVRELAMRSQVGFGNARYTASRLVRRGELVVVEPRRPSVLAMPDPDPATAADGPDCVSVVAGLWGRMS